MKNPLEVLFISFQGQLLNNQKYYKHQIYERNGKNGKANYCFFGLLEGDGDRVILRTFERGFAFCDAL